MVWKRTLDVLISLQGVSEPAETGGVTGNGTQSVSGNVEFYFWFPSIDGVLHITSQSPSFQFSRWFCNAITQFFLVTRHCSVEPSALVQHPFTEYRHDFPPRFLQLYLYAVGSFSLSLSLSLSLSTFRPRYSILNYSILKHGLACSCCQFVELLPKTLGFS